ncbi:MAG: S41 family peptidase [Planctomycetes bacterium]|nr:S41 family peptidase [Planctomycetota bacterium]
MQRNLLLVLAVALIGLLIVMGFGNYMNTYAAGEDDDVYRGVRLLGEAVRLVRDRYVSEVDNRKLYEHAIQGMLQGQDRFSAFISEDELPDFRKQIEGSFGGIGVVIGQRNGWIMVISPIEDGPSYRAGVLAGDRFTEVEGKSTDGMTLDDAVKMLTGKPGTKVTFKVIHETDLKEEAFTITREIIHVKTVKGINRDEESQWQYIVDKSSGVACIRVTSFTNDTVDDLRKAIEEARQQGMKSLILDLRFNGGGVLKGAIAMVDLFIDKGVIVSTRGRNDPEEVYRATEEGTLEDFPMVILVNDRSASASEIVAGALQDHGRAVVLGERTFGKGSVQNIFPLDSGRAAMRLTVAKYYLPSGRCLHREDDSKEWGVDPLIEVKMTPKEYADVFIARRDSEVIRTNGKKANGHGEESEEGSENGEGTDGQSKPLSKTPGDDDGETPPDFGEINPDESQKESDTTEVVDRQLQRAVDVLRMWPLLKKFEVKQAVAE